MFFKRAVVAIMCLILLLSFAGCAENPETPIVKNKDFDKMLEEAKNTQNEDGSKISMSDLVDQYDTYKTTVENDSLNVVLNVDAEVGIPKVDKMSVIRVEQAPFTQEMLDRVRSELVGDRVLYDGSVLHTGAKQDTSDETDETPLTEVANGKITPVRELYNKNQDNEYYANIMGYDPNSSLFYGVSDGKDGNYMTLSVSNSPEQSNDLRFTVGKFGYENRAIPLEDIIFNGERPETQYHEGGITLGQEKAIQTAEAFLEKVGINSFIMADCSAVTDEVMIDEYDGGLVERAYYRIDYTRLVNGAPINEGGGGKHQEGWSDGDFVKRFWHNESIVFHISDDGIVFFQYTSPIRLLETVVEESALIPFEEAKAYFEKMVPIVYASQFDGITEEIHIDRVQFGYTRISEKDNFDTGLLVPVWDFYGKRPNSPKYWGGKTPVEENIMTINAIDGTIIDRELGY